MFSCRKKNEGRVYIIILRYDYLYLCAALSLFFLTQLLFHYYWFSFNHKANWAIHFAQVSYSKYQFIYSELNSFSVTERKKIFFLPCIRTKKDSMFIYFLSSLSLFLYLFLPTYLLPTNLPMFRVLVKLVSVRPASLLAPALHTLLLLTNFRNVISML